MRAVIEVVHVVTRVIYPDIVLLNRIIVRPRGIIPCFNAIRGPRYRVLCGIAAVTAA